MEYPMRNNLTKRCLAAALAVATPMATAHAQPTGPARRPDRPILVEGMGHIVVGGARLSLRSLPARQRIRATCPEPPRMEPAGDFTPEEMANGGADGARLSVRGAQQSAPAPCLPPAQVDPNGDFTPGATYVHFVRLAAPRRPFPLLLLPGGGLSGAVFETTPDGRPGWESFFLRAGYSVFTADLQQTGRSPFARYPEIVRDEPAFRDRAFLWEVFRIGPPGSYGDGQRAFENTQFPVGAFDEFAKLAAPRFRVPPAAEAETYDAIIRSICPCVIVAHSASAGPALAAAYRQPALVKAIIAVEPATVPPPPDREVPPTLILWGDYLRPDQTQADWETEHEDSRRFAATGSGHSRIAFIDLPAIGIGGNSHLLMADSNSDCIAQLIDGWIRANAPRSPPEAQAVSRAAQSGAGCATGRSRGGAVRALPIPALSPRATGVQSHASTPSHLHGGING